MSEIECTWRGEFEDSEVDSLHAAAFRHEAGGTGWRDRVGRHSLGWVVARRGRTLVGFANVAWDGGVHAFLLDPVVELQERRHGLGTELVRVTRVHAAQTCEWLHVDFEEHLRSFYFDAVGFVPTPAGVIRLAGARAAD